MGLRFPKERWRDLERGIRSAAPEFGFKDTPSCIHWLLSAPLTKSQIEILASHLTIGETYFFRDKKVFEILEQHILPEFLRLRQASEKRLRIWSAGCCTGEEPYSIAILLSQIIPEWKDWNITILATDINPCFFQKASGGVYNEWSFRETPLWIKERYFERREDGCFEILPFIRKMVTFSYLNLAEDTYPSPFNNTNAMDLIFCRNVLMYFDTEHEKNVIQNLYRSLVEGGWLIVSPSETSHLLFSQFVTVNFPEVVIYKKDDHRPQTVEVPSGHLTQDPEVSFQPSLEGVPAGGDPSEACLGSGRQVGRDHGRTTIMDWEHVHRRLKAAQAALEQGWAPTPEQKKKILKERAGALAREPKDQAAAGEFVEVVEFLLSYERYGIESSYVREIYPMKELTPLPCTPPFVLGIINVRGQLLSVIDIKKFFDLPEKGLTDLNKVIILYSDRMAFGILADAILGVRNISVSELQPILPTLTGIREDYLKGIAKERVVILNAEKLLSDKRIVVHEEVKT